MRIFQSLLLCLFVFATTSWSCAQNGPTAPSAILTWVQSTTPNPTGNCVYRGTVSGTYTMPAIFCSLAAPVKTWTDTSVQRGSTYYYVVTTKFGAAESGFSNEVKAAIPTIAPPTGAGATETKVTRPKLSKDAPELEAKVEWK